MATLTSELVRLVHVCPRCGHSHLRAVFDGHHTNFRCRYCGACWRADRQFVQLIDARDCTSCRFRALCLDVPNRTPRPAA